MRLDIAHDARLPPLAWLLLHERGDDAARVIAGTSVIAAGDAFWEGVNPCFREPERTPLHHFPLCTGATVRGEEIVAFTPGHIFDRLFLVRRGRRLGVSNALPLLLRALDTHLDAYDILYHWRFGVIQAHRQTAPLQHGKLEFFHNTNIAIDRNHHVRCEAKPLSPDFNSFSEYKEKLEGLIQEIGLAAQESPGPRYEPVSTISSGYDSAAAAVLAKSIGATRAVTISDSRYGQAGDDSGAAIADKLGLSTTSYARDDYRRFGLEAERLFYLFGLPEDISFASFREDIRGTLLFTGHKGDTMWDINGRPVGSWSLDPGGATMQSFRLRADFVHFPPAFFGWARHQKVIDISRSDEMKPWSVGGSYDRPIPRRIVEEAGVPRDLFGAKKRAISAMYGLDKKNYVSESELGVSKDFAELLRQHRQRYRSPSVDLGMAAGNAIHATMRQANIALSRRENANKARGGGGRKSSLKSQLTIAMGYMGNIHRIFWVPFTDLCFSPQVATELLMQDYPAPEEFWGKASGRERQLERAL